MKFFRGTFGKIAAIVAVLSVDNLAMASGTLTIPVTVLGTIAAAPVWQDGLSAPLVSFAFDFTGSAGTVAATAVDSAGITAKIINMSVLTTIVVNTPTTCKIGASAIADTDVKVVVNAVPVSNAGTFIMANAITQPFKLRFAAAGNYGLLAGVVTCLAPGSLVYAY